MNSAFSGLLFGLLGAIILIYLLIVVNFQSWSDPFASNPADLVVLRTYMRARRL
jgi:hypothetical protein